MSNEQPTPEVEENAQPTLVVVHEVEEPVLVVEQEVIVLQEVPEEGAQTPLSDVGTDAESYAIHEPGFENDEDLADGPQADEGDPKAEKSPSFHLLPNSESFHRVKDPLVLRRDKDEDQGTVRDVESGNGTQAELDGDEHKRASFHRLPNSESFHRVKDR